jgi:hypothetical protein
MSFVVDAWAKTVVILTAVPLPHEPDASGCEALLRQKPG